METVKKAVSYRKARFSNNALTLEILLRQALDKTKPSERELKLYDDDTWVRVISGHAIRAGYVFCTLLQYDRGAAQQVIDIDSSGASYEINTVTIEDIAATRRIKGGSKYIRTEFVKSFLYFLVSGNHVVFLGSVGLNASALEKYLGWLLKEQKCIPNESVFVLETRVPREVSEKIMAYPVKKIQIGASLGENGDEESSTGVFVEKSLAQSITGQLADSVKQILKSANDTDKFSDALKQESLDIKLILTYKSKVKKEEDRQRMLNQLCAALQHTDPDAFKATFSDESVYSGQDLMLKSKIKVERSDKGELSIFDIEQGLREWLRSLAEAEGLENA